MALFDILQYWFFQKALLLAVLTAIPCAIIGTYVVVKRISMITGSISHAAFGGLGIAYFLGFNPLLGGTIFGICCGASVGILQRKAKHRLDSILSFLWAFGMALGLVFLYLTPGYAQDLFTYLFGNIFLVSSTELLLLVALNGVISLSVLLLFNTLKLVLFDEEYAEVRNLPILVINILFYVLIALTIIVILSLVGVILLIAFLTLPPATALFYQKTIRRTMVTAGGILIICNVLGLFVAHYLTLPPGPIIVLLLSLWYLVSLAFFGIKKRIQTQTTQIESHSCALEIESFGVFQRYLQDEQHQQAKLVPPSEK